MSYIGNAKTPLLLASNVRDDLLPTGTTNIFPLSQEVPGGAAINVCVVRRRYLTDVLVENTSLIQFAAISPTAPATEPTQSKITITDNYLAAALSIVLPRTPTVTSTTPTDGDYIKITHSGKELKQLQVVSVSYTRDSLEIILDGTPTLSDGTVPPGGNSVLYAALGTNITKIERLYYGPWEILDPEKQYDIVSQPGYTNRKIEIKDFTPTIDDLLYVLHRGEATYNFVPSPQSVGPEQLTENLRNFAVDAAVYNTAGQKTLSLSQVAPSASTLILTANGVVQTSTNESSSSGTWTLQQAVGTAQQITLDEALFTNAASTPVSIRVLHLSFSTISRRAAFAPGQDAKVILNNSVSSTALVSDSVTTSKIKNDSVTGEKIKLSTGTNKGLRFELPAGTTSEILKLTQTNSLINTELVANNAVEIKPGTTTYTLSENSVVAEATNTTLGVSLGSVQKPFKDLHISKIFCNDVEIEGNLKIKGTVDNEDVSQIRTDLTNLTNAVNNIVQVLIPVGTIVAAPSKEEVTKFYDILDKRVEWKLCDGSEIRRDIYSELWTLIKDVNNNGAFGNGNGSTTFNLPDLTKRVIVGKGTSGTLGANEGKTVAERTISHKHTGAAHTHSITHTHKVPGHKHTIVHTAPGSVSIATSGTHDTSLAHSHSQAQTDPTSVNHSHNLTHSHTTRNTGNNVGGDHTHSGTTGSGTQHRHSLEVTRRDLSLTSGRTALYTLGGTADGSTLMGVEQSHTHAFTTGGVSSGFSHYHQFSIPSQTDETDTPISKVAGLANTLSHTHTFTIPDTTVSPTNSTSTGAHNHDSSSFSGFIGKALSDTEGNNDFDTDDASTEISGAANYGTGANTNYTGEETIPHLMLNYWIRVK